MAEGTTPAAEARGLPPDVAEQLVARAAAGDHQAWEQIVDAFIGVLWSTVRRYRLSDADAADVTQTTWLRLYQHIDRLNDPARVGAWLVTTARRECLRVVASRKRQVLTGDFGHLDHPDAAVPGVDTALLNGERTAALRDLMDQLPPRCRTLLMLLTADPAPSYAEISQRLDMPVGSIGPTRARCLKKLADRAAEAGIDLAALRS